MEIIMNIKKLFDTFDGSTNSTIVETIRTIRATPEIMALRMRATCSFHNHKRR